MGCTSIEFLQVVVNHQLTALLMQNVGTLQKSMLLTPLLPKAGPTGGLGLAWPAPTISLTT
jgi:hypothetical protein